MAILREWTGSKRYDPIKRNRAAERDTYMGHLQLTTVDATMNEMDITQQNLTTLRHVDTACACARACVYMRSCVGTCVRV